MWPSPPMGARGRSQTWHSLHEAFNLARRSGWPQAIHQSLVAMALTLAQRNPDQARGLFHQGAALEYENRATLATTCFTAGPFGEWSVLLQTAQRLFHLDRRTGGVPRLWLGGILNLVARGLVVAEPEVAAVIQGSARGLLGAARRGRRQIWRHPRSAIRSGTGPRSSALPR